MNTNPDTRSDNVETRIVAQSFLIPAADKEVFIDKYGFSGGGQFSKLDENAVSDDVKKMRRRESKWLEVLANWESYVTKRFDKVRKRCRKGIPEAIRSRAWQYLCGSRRDIFTFKGQYNILVHQEGDIAVIDQIGKDVGRQYPQHEMFGSQQGFGQQSLFNLLKVYSILYPSTGYCQAQAPIAAALLIHMPEEEAFWTFCAICEHYLPGYFDVGLERVQLDAKILYGLLKRHVPVAYKHLVAHEVEPVYFMVDWFMCIFTRNFPWATVVRVIDMFFCEGIKVIFRIAMALIKVVAGTEEAKRAYNSTESIVAFLRNLPPQVTTAEFIVSESLKFANIPAAEFAYEHLKQRRSCGDGTSQLSS